MRNIYCEDFDPSFSDTFTTYPDLLLVDATHKLNNLQMPLYLLVVVDGNGESEIVGLFLVVSEGEETIRKMTEIFKNHNDYHIFVKTIITDKDFTEREVLATEFEGADLIICRFHVQRNFRREVTTAKLGNETFTKKERTPLFCIKI